ncbi:MAG: AmpG family muropeptide MFS transporter [Alphaproteobacteria bacterium]|nr:AmpG family muropeptide MFS transporter [Alphaproteobacteria bacterium]
MPNKWINALKVYADSRMIKMLLLGFSSGFPYLLVFGTLNLWLKDAGVSLAAIGLFSLVKVPYSFKWLWSPLVDRVYLPLFCKLGRRRGWALFAQVGLFISLWGMAITNPEINPYNMALLAFLTVLSSATQDIVLDAYRIESFNNREQGAAVAVFVLGYRSGVIFSGAGALFMAAMMTWGDVYKVMSLGALVGIITILLSKEPQHKKSEGIIENKNVLLRLKDFVKTAVYSPFADFMHRSNWGWILVFIFLYRMSDAYIAPMAYPFYDDMGFSKIEIASIIKVYGVLATIIGTFVGGVLVSKWGIMRSLLWCGVLQALSNLVFVWQAQVGYNVYVLMVTISVENVSGGMGTAAFVAYLSSLCNTEYTATQYALLSSFMSLARDVLAATSGLLVATVSWSMFFVLTTFMTLPALLILLYLAKQKSFKSS